MRKAVATMTTMAINGGLNWTGNLDGGDACCTEVMVLLLAKEGDGDEDGVGVGVGDGDGANELSKPYPLIGDSAGTIIMIVDNSLTSLCVCVF